MLQLEFGDFLLRERVYRSGLRLPRHSHEYSNVTIVTGGEIVEAAERGEHHGHSCSVVMKPAGSEHENLVSSRGTRTLTIQMRNGSPLAGEVAAREWSWFEHPHIARGAVALQRAVRHGEHVERCALDLVELILSMAAGAVSPPRWIEDVKKILERRFADGIRFEMIARELGMHPVYLSRAFRRHTGLSMTNYVRGLRMRQARHLLADSRRSTAAIAAESGFTDSSHLSHTFSRLLGVTPRAYRRLFHEV